MSTTTPKFRGKSAVRTAYITVTGATYGQGTCFTAGALTRHVSMRKYSPEAVYQAITKLEADGVIEHVGQLKNQAGRANRKYKVLVERDPELVVTRGGSRKGAGRPRKSAVKVAPAAETAAEPVVSGDLDLEVRVAQLEARVAELVAALRSV